MPSLYVVLMASASIVFVPYTTQRNHLQLCNCIEIHLAHFHYIFSSHSNRKYHLRVKLYVCFHAVVNWVHVRNVQKCRWHFWSFLVFYRWVRMGFKGLWVYKKWTMALWLYGLCYLNTGWQDANIFYLNSICPITYAALDR